MKFIRLAAYICLAVIGLAVLVVLAAFAVNAFDEDLNPEVAERLRRIESEKVAQANNAYFPIRGLNAPSGQDIESVGRAIFESEAQSQKEKVRSEPRKDPGIDSTVQAVPFIGDSSSICSVISGYLLENGRCKYEAETDRMFRDNRELLDRYYKITSYGLYEEPMSSVGPVARDLISLMKLANTDIEYDARARRYAVAAKKAARQLRFWQIALTGKRKLISEAIFQVNYRYSTSVLSELLWRYPGLLVERSTLEAALREPIHMDNPVQQASMDREFAMFYEAQPSDILFYGSPKQASPVRDWILGRFYRKNATLNRFHACLARFYAVRSVGDAEFDAEVARFPQETAELSLIDLFVNPTGSVMLLGVCPKRIWFWDPDRHTDASRRLTLIEIMLLASREPASKFQQLIDSADPSLTDPVTRRPAKWDGKRRLVYFDRGRNCIDPRFTVNMGPSDDSANCRN